MAVAALAFAREVERVCADTVEPTKVAREAETSAELIAALKRISALSSMKEKSALH